MVGSRTGAVRRANDALDCSRPAVAVFWGLVGAAFAMLALLSQGAPNAASLLRVGSKNPLRAQIERDLGPLGVSDPIGHDGQLYYLVARAPFASAATVEALIAFDTPRYRYRRILVPLVAGGVGHFSPRATLFGLIACAVVGMALSAIGVADLAFNLRAGGGSALLATLNLGAIASALLVTVDVAALGLALIGTALLLRHRIRWSVIAFVAAALTKETYVLVPLGLAVWQWRLRQRSSAAALCLIPMFFIGAWSLWLVWRIPGIPEPGLLGAPIVGMIVSLRDWARPGELSGVQLAFAAYVLTALVLSIIGVVRSRQTAVVYVAVPWLILLAFTGAGVWGIPTNVGRAFCILWPIGVLSLFARDPFDRS